MPLPYEMDNGAKKFEGPPYLFRKMFESMWATKTSPFGLMRFMGHKRSKGFCDGFV